MASSVEYRQPTPPVAKDSGPGTGIYIAFVPWVLFMLVTDHDTFIPGPSSHSWPLSRLRCRHC